MKRIIFLTFFTMCTMHTMDQLLSPTQSLVRTAVSTYQEGQNQFALDKRMALDQIFNTSLRPTAVDAIDRKLEKIFKNQCDLTRHFLTTLTCRDASGRIFSPRLPKENENWRDYYNSLEYKHKKLLKNS